jgi:viroplasmin and RNaseH domain-containing protein
MLSYVVYKGKIPGVYDDWVECRRQVHHFSGNSYKGYTTIAEAEDRYACYLAGERMERRMNHVKTTFITTMLVVTATLFYVMVV